MSAERADFASIADDLGTVLRDAGPRLRALGESDSLVPRRAGAWTPRQIVGHLVDSAGNNLQRFVRAQIDGTLTFPGYEQERWVEVQRHGERPWVELVDLWLALNIHVAYVIRHIPGERAQVPCVVGGGAPVTLEFLARDYVRHLRHHLGQVLPERP